MVNEQPEKNNLDVSEVTCRIVMDVKIRICEITPESVADKFIPDEDLPWEWAERQKRLMQALLRDGETLKKYLVSIARQDLGALLDSCDITGMSEDEEDDLFEKLYPEICDEDALFFWEARKEGILYHNMRLIHESFKTDWAGTKLEDLHLLEEQSSES